MSVYVQVIIRLYFLVKESLKVTINKYNALETKIVFKRKFESKFITIIADIKIEIIRNKIR